MYTLKNLTNSPQPIPLASGGIKVVPALSEVTDDFQTHFVDLLKLAGTFLVAESISEQQHTKEPEPEKDDVPRRGRPAKAKGDIQTEE